MSILIGIFTFILVLISVFVVLLVLMQRAKNDGGMGAALGGGATEATFGADTGNVLTGATIKAAVAFFVLSFGLYLAHIYQRNHAVDGGAALPSLDAPASLPAAESAAPASDTAPAPEETAAPQP